jgi:hypothetical protein
LTLPSTLWIILCTWIILIPKLLNPLQKLQIILHLAFDQSLNWDRLHGRQMFELAQLPSAPLELLDTDLVNFVALKSLL